MLHSSEGGEGRRVLSSRRESLAWWPHTQAPVQDLPVKQMPPQLLNTAAPDPLGDRGVLPRVWSRAIRCAGLFPVDGALQGWFPSAWGSVPGRNWGFGFHAGFLGLSSKGYRRPPGPKGDFQREGALDSSS